MQQNEIDVIKSSIDSIKKIDKTFLITEKGGKNVIQDLTAKEIIEIINKIIYCFEEAVNQNLLLSFSRYFVDSSNQRNKDIIGILQNLNSYLESASLNSIEITILEIQNFIYQTGIINIYYSKEKPESFIENKQLKIENKNLNVLLKDSVDKVKTLTNEIETLKNDLTVFANDKKNELTQITNNLNSSNNTKQQIDNLHTEIITTKSNSDKITSEISETYKTYKNEYETQKIKFDEITIEIESKENEYKILLENNKKLDISLKQLNESALKTNTELEKLLNPAIAKNLSNTFKSRKEWLFKTTIFWIILSLILSIFLAYYVYELFSNKEFTFELEKVIVSGIKLIPIITLLYFSLRQFTKTRNIEEEYAFRESIATSLMAYAEQIKNDPQKKDELIRETVSKLYESPTNNSNLNNRLNLFSKSKTEMKEILELLKEMKSLSE